MPAYNFKKEFAHLIQDGVKTTTIRFPRKRQTRPKDVLSLYTGMRTKSCELIGKYVCVSVEPIRIDTKNERVEINGMPIDYKSVKRLASGDGFSNRHDFFKFFSDTYEDGVHEMELIRWNPIDTKNLDMELFK